MNITVYLGATEGNDPALITAVKALGTWIGSNGHSLVYGGSRCGLMGMLAQSVLESGSMPGKLADCTERDPAIAFPGGTGTLEEIAEVMSQVALRHLDAPCILYDLNGYYEGMRILLKRMLDTELSTPEKLRGIRFAASLDEIAAILDGDR